MSPVSIQSAVTLAMFGAAGQTRNEMASGLKYPAGYSNEDIAHNFEEFTANVKKTNGLKIGKFMRGRFWIVLLMILFLIKCSEQNLCDEKLFC